MTDQMMRAAICDAYGPPAAIRVESVAKPVPGPEDVLIRIHASTVSSADWRIRALAMPKGFGAIARLIFGFSRPRQPIFGTELSGTIEAVGEKVSRFRAGDAVVAYPGGQQGCHAEYRVMPAEGRIVAKPAKLSFEEAAALSFGGATALHYLRDAAKAQPGERVLVIGGSGAVGTAAIQIARALGAAVDATSSAANIELIRSLGAERAIDYAIGQGAAAAYDIVFDTVGDASVAEGLAMLKPGGRLVLIAASLPQMLGTLIPAGQGRKVIAGPAKESREQLEALATMAEAGQFRPLIDSVFALEAIAEAHTRVETRRKRGSVVVTMPVLSASSGS
ncbi:MAG: NAD(P)-dependent alcohol dehydrogenase [Proteobacteria bacterium]|nr:NAD(P)-dependent alcohol dehydrogenase [Pseudomonadota bacterium]